tara:strand:- start:528 stop:779 length:252 start_codon:yes stop_codon:yes gene_type:complete
MLYGIRESGSKFNVVNKDTGKVKGTHNSRTSAENQRRLIESINNAMKKIKIILPYRVLKSNTNITPIPEWTIDEKYRPTRKQR